MKLFPSWKPKLRLKFIALFLSLSIVPLLFAMIITVLQVQNIERESAAILNKQIAEAASTAVEVFVVKQFQILEDIGEIQREFLEDPQLQNSILERFLFQSEDFVEISIVDWNGKETSREHRLRAFNPEDFRDRAQDEEFLQTRENLFYISPVYISLGRPFFDIGIALAGPEGVFQGAIFAQVDARLMQDVTKDISNRVLEQKGRAYIVNDMGIVIAHPDPSIVLRETSFTSLPAVRALIDGTRARSIEVYENEQGESVIGEGETITFTVSREQIFSPGWFVVVEQPTSIALASVRQITQFSTFVLGFVLLLSIAAALFIAQSLSRPIHELQKGAREIGLGNLDYSFQVDTNDELEDLASEFDKMRFRLKQIRQREENLSKLKSEFVSIAAHQLRTPLSALKWALALFGESNKKFTKNEKDLISKMDLSNERMIRLVNDLLDAARIEEGKFISTRSPTDFTFMIERVISRTKDKARGKKIKLLFQKQKRLLPKPRVDAKAIELALQNLLENALHYTLPGGTVTVSALPAGRDKLMISVRDTGIGIAEEEKKRIFSKFFRGNNAARLETQGSGLGLFIVKNIVESHGGKIWFDSKKGKGTTFFIELPLG